MWITLTACFACFVIGGYAGLCLGDCAGREVVREEVRQMLNGSGRSQMVNHVPDHICGGSAFSAS